MNDAKQPRQLIGVYCCTNCPNVELTEREVSCWKCGKGEMVYRRINHWQKPKPASRALAGEAAQPTLEVLIGNAVLELKKVGIGYSTGISRDEAIEGLLKVAAALSPAQDAPPKCSELPDCCNMNSTCSACRSCTNKDYPCDHKCTCTSEPSAQAVAGEPPALSHTRSCPLLRTMSEDDCTCGLQYRIELQTERELHNAWRKRAEEAELRESVLSKRVADLKEEITLIEALLDKRTEIIRQFLATPEANAGMKVMLDIYEGWQDHALGIEFPPTSHEEAFSVAAHRINCAIAHALRTKPTQGRQGDCKSTVRDIQIGEICRARCGAPARFIGNMKALFISSMCNELQEDAAMPPSGNELNFPLPSDADVERVSGKKIPRENPTLADCTELTRKTLTENWKKREAAAPEPVAEAHECQHFLVLGNDAGGWFCGTCNKSLTRYYVNKYVRG